MTIGLEPAPWRAINDAVMGGVSSGAMLEHGDGLRFSGELSLENNGGFASVRRPVDSDLSAARGVRLEVRGDGRDYQFRIRLDEGLDGVAWRREFSTSGEWQAMEFALEDFEPVFRGNVLPGAGPFRASGIRQFGFMIADRRPGPFALDIRLIQFIGEAGAGS